MRDIDISPDGSYFAVATTGAYASPTSAFLCDTAARWELGATGSALQPTWAQYTGGDTTTEVAITDTAVYVGGHYSYMNNPYIGDSVAAGAVPRESLSAHDPRTGDHAELEPRPHPRLRRLRLPRHRQRPVDRLRHRPHLR